MRPVNVNYCFSCVALFYSILADLTHGQIMTSIFLAAALFFNGHYICRIFFFQRVFKFTRKHFGALLSRNIYLFSVYNKTKQKTSQPLLYLLNLFLLILVSSHEIPLLFSQIEN